jgi:tyrosine-protein phosphatase YwqE
MFKRLFSRSKPLLHTTDLHSPLIPELDDGSQSLDRSVNMILQLQKLGFKKIIITPHVMHHRFPNTKKTIHKGFRLLKNELLRQNINIDLEVATEYYYNEHFLNLIDKKEILTFGDNHMLLELSNQTKPLNLERTVSKLLKSGYKPVLAHPERYPYYNSKEHYSELKKMGLFFQINATSTQGFYGKKIQKAVKNIINLGMVDFVGSDIHSQRYLDSFSESLRSKTYLNIIKNNQIKNDYL